MISKMKRTKHIREWLLLLTVALIGCHRPKRGEPLKAAPTPPRVSFWLGSDGLPTSGMWKSDPVVADFDGDGRLDLAAHVRLGQGPKVWLSRPDGTWVDSSAGLKFSKPSCGGGLAAADFNGDGFIDLAIGDHCQGIFVFLNDGKGRWTSAITEMHPPIVEPGDAKFVQFVGVEDIAVGDVNGDGRLDIASIAQDEGGISLYLADKSAMTWTFVPTTLPATGFGNRIVMTDFNGDGHVDVAASLGVGPRVWRGDGSGGWTEFSTGLPSPIIEGLFHGLDVGDVNGDGRPDLAVANWVDGPEVYLQQADGSWKKTADVFPDMRGGAVGVALGDLDGDGRLDLVCSGRLTLDGGYVRGVFALLGDGSGHWTYVSESGLPETGLSAMGGVVIADFNGDAMPDIAAASGLLVETTAGPSQPSIPQRMLVWFNAQRSPADNAP